MGGIAKSISKATGKLLGADQGNVRVPKTPKVEDEYKKAEEEALRKRAALADKGMSGTILGGSLGGEGGVQKKKLLGE